MKETLRQFPGHCITCLEDTTSTMTKTISNKGQPSNSPTPIYHPVTALDYRLGHQGSKREGKENSLLSPVWSEMATQSHLSFTPQGD